MGILRGSRAGVMLKKWQPAPMPRHGGGGNAPPSESAPPSPAFLSTSFGPPAWTEKDLIAGMADFLALYDHRPIRKAEGGMLSVGLFAFWHFLRSVRPDQVIECGVNQGLTTWLIEATLPAAKLVCLDQDFSERLHQSEKARYLAAGFLEADVPVQGGNALALFDDHGSAPERVRKCLDLGIKHLLFDDNYPDLSGNRHLSLAACLQGKDAAGRDRFPQEKAFLLERTEIYSVFPPVFDYAGAVTQETSFIREPSLRGKFESKRDGIYKIFMNDMPGYRWPTYLKLR